MHRCSAVPLSIGKERAHPGKRVKCCCLLCTANPPRDLHGMKGEAMAKPREFLPSLGQPHSCSKPPLPPAKASARFPSHTSSVRRTHERSSGAQSHPVTLSDMGSWSMATIMSADTIRRNTHHQRQLNWYFRHDQKHLLVSRIKILLQNNGLPLSLKCWNLYIQSKMHWSHKRAFVPRTWWGFMLNKQYGIQWVTSCTAIQTCPNQAEGVLSDFRYMQP